MSLDDAHRTCVACRALRPRDELLRFVRGPDGAVFFDVKARVASRGAWTCASARCVRQAVERGAFARTFEAPVLVESSALLLEVERQLDDELLASLGLCRRAGVLAAGRSDVALLRENARGEVFVLASSDLSERTRGELDDGAVPAPPMERVGAAVGRGETGIVAVAGGGPLASATRAAALRRARFLGLLPQGEPALGERSPSSAKVPGPPCDGGDQGV